MSFVWSFLKFPLAGFFGRSLKGFQSQVRIEDGTDQPLTSTRAGQTFTLGKGDTAEVDGAPVLTIDDKRVTFKNAGTAETTGETATIDVEGDRARIKNLKHGEILAEDTAIEVSGRGADIHNRGLIDGDINGVNFANGGESSGTLRNYGTVSSDSRAVNIGGDGIKVHNYGDIVGTGDQRNGTIYSDATAENYAISNYRHGTIDAGEGNQGAGIALQTGNFEGDRVKASITNHGTIEGRGQAAANTGLAGDGVRIFSGVEGGGTTFKGWIYNNGDILSESQQGPTAALRISDGVGFDGKIVNGYHGLIDGANNGLYFGDGDHDAQVKNYGTIQSDSRAVNIDGSGVDLHNYGDILGTGDQRNGTVYSDATAEDYSISNYRYGLIDAGEENQGAGIALQTGDVEGDVVRASISNSGTIEGRGQATANSGLAGDGLRVFSGVEGGATTLKGWIYNNGDILSESQQGPTAAVRFSDGLGFDGKLVNDHKGLIDGANNGLYFGNAEHDAQVKNYGTIQSDSRAVNIDGSGVELHNYGDILGTGDQRNGTVYSDATAEDYKITNFRYGLIDAGEDNQGAGVALQTGDTEGDVVEASLTNYGTIEGRGQAAANTGLAGDGVRVFSGVEGGGTTFKGTIYNSGDILSESQQGPTAAVRFSDGLGFDGRLVNDHKGLIDGANNGLYFGNAEHDARVENYGTIQSDSRAVNIDGSGVELHNFGDILGTGNQRNGTVYSDATAEDYAITNHRSGLIDAGKGNQGAGVSLQTGEVDGDVVVASLDNQGRIIGRGEGEGNLTGDGVRVFAGASGGETTFQGDIVNKGLILSEAAAGIRFAENVSHDGEIQNHGTIEGDVAIDVSLASGSFTVENHGTLIGDVLLSEGSDLFDSSYGGSVDGTVFGNGGDDEILGGDSDDVLVGGLGDDSLDGGRGTDTARYDDADIGVQVDLAAGTANRETGFNVTIEDLALINPNGGIDAAAIVDQGAAGNLYFNIHTTDFPSGEIRGNLTEVVSDETVGGVRTLVLRAELDGASEVPAPTNSDATGIGLVTFVVAADGSVTYDLDLSVNGLNTADLLPVNIGNGTLSPIHLHNAPPGVNGPVVVDLASDAGFDVANGDDAFALAAGFDLVAETDSLEDIENLVGSNDSDVLSGDTGANKIEGLDGDDEIFGGAGGGADTLIGGAGDDILAGGGGTDVIDGGEGIDTNSFFNINATAPDPTVAGVEVQLNADGSGTATYTVAAGPAAGNVINESFTGIENIVGTVNDDTIVASGAAANRLEGGDGDDLLAGGGGADVLIGGAGNDVIRGGGGQDITDGGAGVDTADFSDIGAPVVANLNSGVASYAPNPNVTIVEQLLNFENLTGSENRDQLFGDSGNNDLKGLGGDDFLAGGGGADLLEGGEGNDVLRGGGGGDVTDGGAGIDTADFGDIGSAVTADLDAGTASYAGPGGLVVDALIDIENLRGSDNDDVLTGDSGDNVIGGGLGSDHLIGGGGNDVLRGDELGLGTALKVTVENLQAPGGTFLTPVWFGFHDGVGFDLFDLGSAASQGLERLAEDGTVDPISAEFLAAAGATGVDGTIFGLGAGVPGPIDPGESASAIINVDDPSAAQFFTWATMVIPSNDAFLATTDDPQGEQVFDADGNFLGPVTITRTGADVLDAGTEVNDEEGAAFLNQTAPDQGTVEGGTVGAHPGFNGSAGNPGGTPVNILDPAGANTPGGPLDPAVADFTIDPTEALLTIAIESLASFGAADTLEGGYGEDILDGGVGDDILIGGEDHDTFVFLQGTGDDTVNDFVQGEDVLDVSDIFDDAADAVAASNLDGAGNTVIDLGFGDSVTLIGVVDPLNQADFIVA